LSVATLSIGGIDLPAGHGHWHINGVVGNTTAQVVGYEDVNLNPGVVVNGGNALIRGGGYNPDDSSGPRVDNAAKIEVEGNLAGDIILTSGSSFLSDDRGNIDLKIGDFSGLVRILSDTATILSAVHNKVTFSANPAGITKVVGASFTAPVAGSKAYVVAPFAGTIVGWKIIGDPTGSVVIDVWKRNILPPTVGNTITAAAKPTVSSAAFARNAGALTGWTTAVAKDDVFVFNIDSITSMTAVSITLEISTT
jgi:hypothetical protein